MKREDVEALLEAAQQVAPADAVFGPERIGVEGLILAELCRAWLALEQSEDVVVHTQLGNTIVTRVTEGAHYKGRRVRIVPVEDEKK